MYQAVAVFKVQPQVSHLFTDDLEGDNHIREDYLANFLPLVCAEAVGID